MNRIFKKQGAALLTVLVAMTIISILLFEFQYSARIEQQLAFNEITQAKAYYLAKSGIRIGVLRLALYGRLLRSPLVKNAPAGFDIKTYLDMVWNLPLPAFPPSDRSLKKLAKKDQDAAEKVLEETRVDEGQSTHVITTESAKINLNHLIVPAHLQNERLDFYGEPKGLHDHVARLLKNLIDNFIKDSENPNEEYGDLRSEEVVGDIMDWVNPGDNRFMGGNKDAYYESLIPPYKAKRNRFYTIDELRMVRGINEKLFQKIKPHVTVFSYDGKININTASTSLHRALYPDFKEEDVKRILDERTRIEGWKSESQFVQFITDTLGRSDFARIYNNPNDYPFTTGTQSFLIESLGLIQRSGSQIQRSIRVAVAMASGKGGAVDTSITVEDTCKRTPGRFWDPRDSKCKSKPTSQSECTGMPGQWEQRGNAFCCVIQVYNGHQDICQEANDRTAKGDLSTMRILYWSEI